MTREEFLSKAKPEVATFVRWLEENAPKLRLWENAIRGGPQLKYKHESLPKFKFNFGQLTPGGWLVQTARLSERFGKKPRPPQKICTHYLRRVKGIIGKEAGITISKGREQLYHATTGGKGVVPLDSLIRRKEEWLAIIDETIQRINDVVGKPPKSRGAPKAPGPKPRRPRKRANFTPEDLKALNELDESRNATSRLEQRILRELVLKGKEQGECAICGDTYPVALLVAAHIKKRKECNDPEKRDPKNVVAMCKFGCDDLFERGYISVREGCVADNPERPSSKVVRRRIGDLKDRKCESWNRRTAKYFKWHDEQARKNSPLATAGE